MNQLIEDFHRSDGEKQALYAKMSGNEIEGRSWSANFRTVRTHNHKFKMLVVNCGP